MLRGLLLQAGVDVRLAQVPEVVPAERRHLVGKRSTVEQSTVEQTHHHDVLCFEVPLGVSSSWVVFTSSKSNSIVFIDGICKAHGRAARAQGGSRARSGAFAESLSLGDCFSYDFSLLWLSLA